MLLIKLNTAIYISVFIGKFYFNPSTQQIHINSIHFLHSIINEYFK